MRSLNALQTTRHAWAAAHQSKHHHKGQGQCAVKAAAQQGAEHAWWLLASMAASAEGGSGWEKRAAGCREPQEAWKAAGVSTGRGSKDSVGGGAGAAATGMAKSPPLSPSRSSTAEAEVVGTAAGPAVDTSEGPGHVQSYIIMHHVLHIRH